MDKYMTIREASTIWNVTPRRIQVLCSEGRVDGAERLGHIWLIPREAEKPGDARLKAARQ